MTAHKEAAGETPLSDATVIDNDPLWREIDSAIDRATLAAKVSGRVSPTRAEADKCIECAKATEEELRLLVRRMFHAAGYALNRELRDRAETDERERDACRAALGRSIIAIDDWLHSYAPEMCGEEYVKATAERLGERGTLAYIADVQQQNRAAIDAARAPGAAK